MDSYLFDSGSDLELRRLQTLCWLYDDGTKELLSRVGLRPGARCLEVAAGTGSIARFLVERVGRGHVVATDVDTRYLDSAKLDGVETRKHDILSDPLEEASYSVIHTRALLMHLPDRDRAIANMLRALAPGGTLLLEDIILTSGVSSPALPLWPKMIEAASATFRSVGADPLYGMQLVHALRRRGFASPSFELRAAVAVSGTPSDGFYSLGLRQLRPAILRCQMASESEIDEVLGALDEPGRLTLAPLMAACWIVRPG